MPYDPPNAPPLKSEAKCFTQNHIYPRKKGPLRP